MAERSGDPAIRLFRHICEIAGAPNIIDDARVGLAQHRVIAADERRDTPVIFDWLIVNSRAIVTP